MYTMSLILGSKHWTILEKMIKQKCQNISNSQD